MIIQSKILTWPTVALLYKSAPFVVGLIMAKILSLTMNLKGKIILYWDRLEISLLILSEFKRIN